MPKGWQLGKWLAKKMSYKTRRDGGHPHRTRQVSDDHRLQDRGRRHDGRGTPPELPRPKGPVSDRGGEVVWIERGEGQVRVGACMRRGAGGVLTRQSREG